MLFPQLEVHTAPLLFLEAMSLLFIPAVRRIIYWADIQSNALAIAIAIIVTTSISLGITAGFHSNCLIAKAAAAQMARWKARMKEAHITFSLTGLLWLSVSIIGYYCSLGEQKMQRSPASTSYCRYRADCVSWPLFN